VITAQSLTTLDHISAVGCWRGLVPDGRKTEFEMTGIPFPPITERLRMLDEALTVIRSLWANERTTFNGEFYKLKDAILWPKPIQKPHPPIIVGGGGKGLLRDRGQTCGLSQPNSGRGEERTYFARQRETFRRRSLQRKVKFRARGGEAATDAAPMR